MKNEAVLDETNYYDFLEDLKQIRKESPTDGSKKKSIKEVTEKRKVENAYAHFIALIFITVLCETFFLLLGFYLFR